VQLHEVQGVGAQALELRSMDLRIAGGRQSSRLQPSAWPTLVKRWNSPLRPLTARPISVSLSA